MEYEEAIKAIVNNYPPEKYSMLREALDLSIRLLQDKIIEKDHGVADIVSAQREEIEKFEKIVESMRSEIQYAINSNKPENVKRHYLDNALRYAGQVLVVN